MTELKPPDKIYLQWYDPLCGEAPTEIDDSITWCQDKINSTDVLYIRPQSLTEKVKCMELKREFVAKDGTKIEEYYLNGSNGPIVTFVNNVCSRLSFEENLDRHTELVSTDEVDAKVSLNQASQEDRDGLSKFLHSGRYLEKNNNIGVSWGEVADAILKEYVMVRRDKSATAG